jgi:membrane protease YdiL (CAAX protease family)
VPDHSSDATRLDEVDFSALRFDGAGLDLDDEDAPPRTRHRRRRRTDWRLGGRTVLRWREGMLAWACIVFGVMLLAGSALQVFLPGTLSALIGTGLAWVGMLVPIVIAFSRSRPVGLLRLRPLDLLYGVALGLILRLTQGWLEMAAGGSGALPSYPRIGGSLPDGWWFTDAVSPVVIAPLVEEFFFRAVLLVSVYAVLRRAFGGVIAGGIAVVASTGLFLLAHGLDAVALDQVVSLALLGLVCGLTVVLTGRIWGAVLIHVVYNGSFVLLALAGTLLG